MEKPDDVDRCLLTARRRFRQRLEKKDVLSLGVEGGEFKELAEFVDDEKDAAVSFAFGESSSGFLEKRDDIPIIEITVVQGKRGLFQKCFPSPRDILIQSGEQAAQHCL